MFMRKALFGGLILLSINCFANEEKEAYDAILKATNKQFGIDYMVTEWAKAQLPPQYLQIAHTVVPVIDALSTGRILISWELE